MKPVWKISLRLLAAAAAMGAVVLVAGSFFAGRLMSPLGLLIVVVAFAAGLAAWFSSLWCGRDFKFAPAGESKRPFWAARLAEAAVILAGGAVVMFMLASLGMRPSLAMFLGAGAAVLIGAALALLWRTWAGFTLAVVGLLTCTIIANARFRPMGGFPTAAPADAKFVITLPDDIEGAEVWINGVMIGTSPVVTTFEELGRKIPYWPQPPAGFKSKEDEIRIPYYSLTGGGEAIKHTWFECSLWPASGIKLDQYPLWNQGKGKCYMRIRLDGEWGAGFGGGSNGSGNGTQWVYVTTPTVEFPQRERRIGALLNQARAKGYAVEAAWFQAMDGFGKTGWRKLQEAAQAEPDLNKVADDWARWKYDLANVTDSAAAQRLLEQIGAEADQAGEYFTGSLAGRAVELIAPRLNPDWLAGRAVEFVREWRHGTYSYGWSMQWGKEEFSVHRRYVPNADSMVPVSIGVVAHAVWLADLRLKQTGGRNVMQDRVGPELVRAYKPDLALRIGGFEVDQYLVRHDWRKGVHFGDSSHEDGEYVGVGGWANRWLVMLAKLNDYFGQEFRAKHHYELMELADRILSRPPGWDIRAEDAPEFLFEVPGLALEYWPRFGQKVAASPMKWERLRALWGYLARITPAAPAKMYVEAWRENVDYPSAANAIEMLGKLPADERREVIRSIQAEVAKNLSLADGQPESSWRTNIEKALEAQLPDNDLAEVLFQELRDEKDREPQTIENWLTHTRLDQPLVAMLAEAQSPRLRLLAMGALREHPTPTNQAILSRLCNDSDESVRQGALAVRADVEQLKQANPGVLAAVSSQPME